MQAYIREEIDQHTLHGNNKRLPGKGNITLFPQNKICLSEVSVLIGGRAQRKIT